MKYILTITASFETQELLPNTSISGSMELIEEQFAPLLMKLEESDTTDPEVVLSLLRIDGTICDV